MSEEIRELGEVAYVGYLKASDGKSLISGVPLPAWDEQAPEIRQAWNLAAMAVVDRWREAGEDAPGSGPQPAKVIIVREASGRECRYDANQADPSEYGQLRILRKGAEVGGYQANGWLSWREDGAIPNDGPADKRKLAIALAALRDINVEAEKRDDAEFFGIAAEGALTDIADVDL